MEKRNHALDSGWRVIIVVWGALLASLGIYLIVCKLLESQGLIKINTDFPIEIMKDALAFLSVITLGGAIFLRQYILKRLPSQQQIASQGKSATATGRYLVTIVITSALCESVGIYGVILFLLSQESVTLYLFIFTSALAMVFLRPVKKEFMAFAAQISEG